jgi:hypothetical protein
MMNGHRLPDFIAEPLQQPFLNQENGMNCSRRRR